MKNIAFLLLAMLITTSVYAQKSENMFDFEYPFHEGDLKWKEFRTAKERISALQIPSNKLSQITTQRLLEICLDFPYLYDMLAFNQEEKGFESVTRKFNGFGELLHRKDISKVLLEKYNKLTSSVKDIKKTTDIDKGYFSFKCYFLLYMLKSNNIYHKMTPDQKDSLLSFTRKNITTVESHPDIFGYSCLNKMKQINDTNANHIIRSQTSDEYFWVYESLYKVYTRLTPSYSNVRAGKLVTEEFTTQEKSAYKNYVETHYNVEYVSEATRKYNCHAYAWHMSEGQINDSIWIGDNATDEDIYWNDGSFIEVPQSFATKVSYSTAEHSAVIHDANRFRSKWGQMPLVIHYPNDTPYDSTAAKKYYIKNTMRFLGHKFVCGSETYAVKGLPTGASVTWDFVQTNGDDEAIITPLGTNGDSCLVYGRYGSYELFEGLLYARVYLAGTLIKTYTQYIYEDGDFIGFYWDGTPYDNVYENYMTEDDNWITQGSMMLVRSDNLRGKSINIYRNSEYMPIVSGGTTNGTSDFLYEVLGFAPGDTLRMQVYGDGSCTTDEFMFYVQSPSRSQNNQRTLQIQLMGENQYKFQVSGTEKNNEFSAISTSDEVRKYYVYNASSLRLVSTDTYTGTEFIVDASSWPTGTYIVFTKIKGKTYSAKFVRK